VPPLVKLLLIIIGALLLLPEQKSNELSGIRKRRNRRLFYLLNGRVIPRAQVSNAKAMAAAGRGSLYAVWAETADQARRAIQEGRAERYFAPSSLLGETRLEPWQMTLDEFSNVGESQRARAWGVRMAIRDRGTGKIYPGGEKDRLHLDVLSKIQPVQIRIKDIEAGFILPDGTYFTKWSKDTMKTPEGFRYIDEGYKADLHRLIVQRAKSEGKNVPREVLSQYNLGGFISHIPRMFIMSRIIKSLRE